MEASYHGVSDLIPIPSPVWRRERKQTVEAFPETSREIRKKIGIRPTRHVERSETSMVLNGNGNYFGKLFCVAVVALYSAYGSAAAARPLSGVGYSKGFCGFLPIREAIFAIVYYSLSCNGKSLIRRTSDNNIQFLVPYYFFYF